MWLHSLKVAQLLRSAACLHTNQSRSYLNHLVLRKCVEYDTLPVAKRFGSASVTTVSLHEPVKKARKCGGGGNSYVRSEEGILQLSYDMSGLRHVISYHVLNRKHTHTHAHRTATLEFPINKVITFRNASHQNDRWFASWNIKKCLSVEIKSFRTRTVARNGGELLQYDSGDTTHS